MSRFLITLQVDGSDALASGVLAIGDCVERFEATLGRWSAADYRRHWEEALRRLMSGEGDALFLTDVPGAEGVQFFRAWVAYRDREDIVFQELILFVDPMGEDIDLTAPWRHIPARRTVTEDGEAISEWRVHGPVDRAALG